MRHVIASALDIAHGPCGGLHVQRDQLHFSGRVVHLRQDVRMVDLVEGTVGRAFRAGEDEAQWTGLRVRARFHAQGEAVLLVALLDRYAHFQAATGVPDNGPTRGKGACERAGDVVRQRFNVHCNTLCSTACDQHIGLRDHGNDGCHVHRADALAGHAVHPAPNGPRAATGVCMFRVDQVVELQVRRSDRLTDELGILDVVKAGVCRSQPERLVDLAFPDLVGPVLHLERLVDGKLAHERPNAMGCENGKRNFRSIPHKDAKAQTVGGTF